MSNYQLYQDTLTSAGYGTPLWEPSSSTSQKTLQIGDVGYLRFGTFIRLFNVTLPSGHPDNENGEPQNYVPLTVHPTQRHRTVIPKGIIATSGVQVSSFQQKDKDARISFKCTDKLGAVVMADDEVIREDVVFLSPFANYAAAHAHDWIKFARQILMREIGLHELILLTGCDLTKGRYSVTVFNGARTSKRSGHGASFQLPYPASNMHICSDQESIRYFQYNYGPSSSIRSVTPCLFIRGFKLLDRHVERMEQEEAEQSELEEIYDAQFCSPLDAILRYLCDTSDADMALAHDLDLTRLLLRKNKVSWNYKHVLKRLRKGHQPFISQNLVASLI